jgi:hypothetical protein
MFLDMADRVLLLQQLLAKAGTTRTVQKDRPPEFGRTTQQHEKASMRRPAKHRTWSPIIPYYCGTSSNNEKIPQIHCLAAPTVLFPEMCYYHHIPTACTLAIYSFALDLLDLASAPESISKLARWKPLQKGILSWNMEWKCKPFASTCTKIRHVSVSIG